MITSEPQTLAVANRESFLRLSVCEGNWGNVWLWRLIHSHRRRMSVRDNELWKHTFCWYYESFYPFLSLCRHCYSNQSSLWTQMIWFLSFSSSFTKLCLNTKIPLRLLFVGACCWFKLFISNGTCFVRLCLCSRKAFTASLLNAKSRGALLEIEF